MCTFQKSKKSAESLHPTVQYIRVVRYCRLVVEFFFGGRGGGGCRGSEDEFTVAGKLKIEPSRFREFFAV